MSYKSDGNLIVNDFEYVYTEANLLKQIAYLRNITYKYAHTMQHLLDQDMEGQIANQLSQLNSKMFEVSKILYELHLKFDDRLQEFIKDIDETDKFIY